MVLGKLFFEVRRQVGGCYTNPSMSTRVQTKVFVEASKGRQGDIKKELAEADDELDTQVEKIQEKGLK